MIFPQTSHFDDLQKQKGKRLHCGVFPFGAFFLFVPYLWLQKIYRQSLIGQVGRKVSHIRLQPVW